METAYLLLSLIDIVSTLRSYGRAMLQVEKICNAMKAECSLKPLNSAGHATIKETERRNKKQSTRIQFSDQLIV